jgi:hypothetical protein
VGKLWASYICEGARSTTSRTLYLSVVVSSYIYMPKTTRIRSLVEWLILFNLFFRT